MQEILSPNELCSAILTLKYTSGKENIAVNSTAEKSRPGNKLISDVLNNTKIRSIQKQLSNNKPFDELLKPVNQELSFVIPNNIIQKNFRSYNTNDFSTLMNSYLKLCIEYQNLDIKKAILLLKSISNFYVNYKMLNKKQNHILASAFYNLYMCTLFHKNNQKEIENYDELIHVLCEFFMRINNVLPAKCFNMFYDTVKLIVNPNDRKFQPMAAEFISFIDSLVIQLGKQFPESILTSILQVCCGAISGLDSTALLFFSHLTKIVDQEKLSTFLPLLPLAMMSYIDSQEKPLIRIDSNEFLCDNGNSEAIQAINNKSYFYPENDFVESNFGDSFDLTNKVVFPETLSFESIFSNETLCKINIIENAISSNDILIFNFIQMVPKIFQSSSKSIFALDTYAIFLLIVKQISSKKNVLLPMEFLAHRVCFNPKITVFNQMNTKDEEKLMNWSKINMLRTVAMELIIHQGITGVQTILYGAMIYPQLFAELFHRLINTQQQLKIDQSNIAILTQTLMSPMIYYQHFTRTELTTNKEKAEEMMKSITEARLSILLFINNIFLQPSVIPLFFEDQFFIESFLSLLFEYPLRKSVIYPLLSYMISDKIEENEMLLNQIISIFKVASKEMKLIDAVNLTNELLNLINQVVLMKSKLTNSFKPLICNLCKNCINIPKHQESEKMILNLIQFITITSDRHWMTTPDFIALETAIIKVFDGEHNQSLFSKIVQLIAGQTLPSLHPSFTIRQPKALRLLVAVFKSSQMLPDVFTFIAKLLQHSFKNCEEAHRGEFDLYMIGLLETFRNDKTYPLTAFASALSLLMLIASNISSVSVVQSFISLLCPIEGKHFPHFQKLLIRSLSSMIPSTNKRPLSVLPLSSKTGFNFKGLKGEMFQEGFTFTFWIYLTSDDPKYKQQVIMLQDTKGNKCGVFVTACSILVFLESNESQWSAKPDASIPMKKWSFISVCCFFDDVSGQFRVATTINGEDGRDLFFPIVKLQPGPVRGRIGGLSVDSIDIEFPSFLGATGIFQPVMTDHISNMYELGPCIENIRKIQPYAYFVPYEHSGELSLLNKSGDGNVIIETEPLRYFHPTPFADVLISKCGVSSIIPLFAQWGMGFPDSEGTFENFEKTTIEILQSMLALSVEAQQTFCNENGFKIISHLMMKQDVKGMSYSLYLQFFNILNDISCAELQKQLFESILMNVELWMKCDAENHRRIVRHWSKSLIQTCSEITVELYSFSWIVSTLRVYYWYEPIERGIALNIDRCRKQKLNVKDCRSSLISIGHFIAQVKFDEIDFKNLISHVLTCTDHEQNADLIRLLNDLIKDQGILSKNVKHSIHLISLLQYLFNLNNSSVICSTLATIVDAHRAGLFEANLPISNHIDIILHQVVPQFATKTMLNCLINLTSVYPEAFPICSWVAMNIGDKGIRLMLQKIHPSEKLAQNNESWALYAVVALYKGNDKLKRYLSRFLLKCSIENEKYESLPILFATIEIIGRALNENSDDLKHVLLIEYGKMIKRESLKIDNYMILVRHHLFYRIDRKENEALIELFDHSPFSEIPNVSLIIPNDFIQRKTYQQKNKLIAPSSPLMTPSSPLATMQSFDNSPPHSSFASPPRRNNKHKIPIAPSSPTSPSSVIDSSISPKKSGNRRTNRRRRTSRHSLRPSTILFSEPQEDRYSPLLAQKALACLNPVQQPLQSNESFRARRTSMLTIGKKAVDYENSTLKSPDHNEIILMPNELDEKINEVAKQEFKFTFGLRLNRNQEWQDFDLAEQAFDLYLENPEMKYEEISTLIASFLGRWKPEITKKAKFSENNKLLLILDHYMIQQNKGRLTNNDIRETEQIAFSIFQSFESSGSTVLKTAPLRFMKHLIKFHQINSEKAFDIFALITDEIVALASNKMADFSDNLGQIKSQNGLLWTHFWNCATIERAPWHKSLPLSCIKQLHFKRDNTSCFAFCPMKLKQNRNFNDHMDATFLRESGNFQNAKDLLEKYKVELAKQYSEKAPLQLLEIIEDSINIEDDNFDGFLSNSNKPSSTESLTRCLIELPCEIIKIKKHSKATFSLLNDMIILTKEKNGRTQVIYNNQISKVLFRTFLHHPTAIEIFTINGNSYFINFFDVKSLPIIRSFSYLSLPSMKIIQNNSDFKSFFKDLPYTQQWVNRKLSNFEYLLYLNIFSGRTFNDPSQYPIMPWIIQDYSSNKLDLDNSCTFRDLSKPIGAIDQERIEELRLRTKSLKNLGIEPYLYSCGAVNPLSTYLFMLRVEPFTSLHIEIQSGRFDHTARLFNSVPHAFKLASSNMNDYREIIPEFYYLSEFLKNTNHFDFGSFEGKRPNDVELPPWASNPVEFVYLHRKALESEHVSQNLQKWIDLVWGEKQKGTKAVESDNVFMSNMYDDVWDNEENLRNPTKRAQIEAVLTHVGQIPHQLFNKAHPTRISSNNNEPIISVPFIYSINKNIDNESTSSSIQIIASTIKTNIRTKKAKLISIDENGSFNTTLFDLLNAVKSSQQQQLRDTTKKSFFGRSFSNGSSKTNKAKNNKKADRLSDITNSAQYRSADTIISSKTVLNFRNIHNKDSCNNKLICTLLNDESYVVVGINKREISRIARPSNSLSSSSSNDVIIRQADDITCIASDEDWLATANRDAIVNLYFLNDFSKPKYSIPLYTSSISCICINNEFHTMICGTRDGSLIFCSLNSGSITRIVNLKNSRPISVLVTPTWGFVVVYETEIVEGKLIHKIEVYSINGELIKSSLDHDSAVVAWSSFRDEKGFDFVILANEKNECFIFEAYYINITHPFYIAPSKVSTIAFLNEESVAAMATTDSKFLFVPYYHQQT